MDPKYLRLSINVKHSLKINKNVTLTDMEEEGRMLYLALIGKLEAQIEQGSVKQDNFQNLVDEIKKNVFKHIQLESEYQPSNREISFTWKGEIVKASGPVISIGKLPNNTISLHDDTVSRLHALILVFENHLVVVDSWSLNGTKCTHREDKSKLCEGSFCNHRTILNFGKNESFQIMVGLNYSCVSFFPKECVVCLDKARQIRHNCGHGVICKECYLKLERNMKEVICPICRHQGRGKESHCYNSFSIPCKS